jgi:DNA-directed RNA polymerase specialized sigma24 family protein
VEQCDNVLTEEAFQETPVFTKFAFTRLLEWLDDGVDSQGERYLEVRRRLVLYFDRRNRPGAEDLADETLSRVAKTLERTGTIVTRPPARYCYVVARFVLLEDCRRDRRHVPFDGPRRIDFSRAGSIGPVEPDEPFVVREQRLDCLEPCLRALRPEQRELTIEYFRGAGRQRIERRRALAMRMGITMNALGIRAFRIRDALMTCVEGCRQGRWQG